MVLQGTCGFGMLERMKNLTVLTGVSFALSFAFAGCALFDNEPPESYVVIEETKPSAPDKVVIDTAMKVRFYVVL